MTGIDIAWLVVLVASFLWAMIWLDVDSYWTDKGIKAGLAVEGNWYVRLIVGAKPTFWELMLVNGAIDVALLLLSLLPTFGAAPHIWFVVSIVTLTISGVMNIRGSRQWKWMFLHPGKTIPPGDTFWQKFLGFWG